MDALPPKTCSIDRLITRPDDVRKVIEGKKTSQRRNGRYADPGEEVVYEGKRFVVTRVHEQRLAEMTDEDARSEGQSDLAAYFAYIASMHPGMPAEALVRSSATTWVHELERA